MKRKTVFIVVTPLNFFYSSENENSDHESIEAWRGNYSGGYWCDIDGGKSLQFLSENPDSTQRDSEILMEQVV